MTGGDERQARRTVITFGTFDLPHVGHVRILQRAAALGDRLVVGVSSDELNWSKKRKVCQFTYEQRAEIVRAFGCVDEVFKEESLELKPQYVLAHGADLLVMGDDWAGRFDDMPCEVRYLPRTEDVSTTSILRRVRSTADLGCANRGTPADDTK